MRPLLCVPLQRLLQLVPTLLGTEIGRINQVDALILAQTPLPGAGKHHVRRLVHHHARRQNRILHALYANHRASAQGVAVHDYGIQLVLAVVSKHRALASIEVRIVFEHNQRRCHRLNGRFASFELSVAITQLLGQRCANYLLLRRRHVVPNHASTTADHQERRHFGVAHADDSGDGRRKKQATKLHEVST